MFDKTEIFLCLLIQAVFDLNCSAKQTNNLIIFLSTGMKMSLPISFYTWCIPGSVCGAIEEQNLIVPSVTIAWESSWYRLSLRIWESKKPYVVWRKRVSCGCVNAIWEQQSPRKLRWSTIYLRCLRPNCRPRSVRGLSYWCDNSHTVLFYWLRVTGTVVRGPGNSGGFR